MAVRPAFKPKIVKKRTKHFTRHQSDRYVKVKVSIVVNIKITQYLIHSTSLIVLEQLEKAKRY